jgi:uncharacterized protein
LSTERQAIVEDRLARADEALAAADALQNSGHWTAAVNRLYYACFYAASALLLRHGFTSRKHSGIQGIFNREFVRTGAVPANLGRFYTEIFTRRLQGDYADFVRFEEIEVRQWSVASRELVTHIQQLVAQAYGETR